MKLKVLGSSSKGNCYILESKKDSLIIEAGVNIKEIKQAVNWPVVSGCVVSHEHGDHAKSVSGLMRYGVNVYASPGTFKALKIVKNTHRTKKMQSKIWYQIGTFRVMPFDIEHDAEQPFAFIISHPESGNILFATDTHYLLYQVEDLSQIIIEANYSDKIVEENIESGKLPYLVRNRLLNSHMSLETCMHWLSQNDLSKVMNIVLIHLSPGNSHPKQFNNAVYELTRKKTFIARKGLSINFNKNPF